MPFLLKQFHSQYVRIYSHDLMHAPTLSSLFLLLLIACPPLAIAQNISSAPTTNAGDISATNLPVINGYAEQLKAKRSNPANVTSKQPYVPIKKPNDEGQIPEIEMFVGESRVFPAPGVGRIAVGNGAILTAAALDGKEVILFANAVGTSSLFIWNEDGRYQRVKISIAPGDTSRYAREIAAFLTSIPKAKASIIGDKVIVEGDELSDTELAKIELLSTRYPQIVNFTNRLGFEQMVMLDVKVVEFPITYLRELGVKWGTTGGGALGGIWSPIRRGDSNGYEINLQTGRDNPAPITGANGTPPILPSGLKILSALNLGLNATVNALAQEGKTTILAEPQLSARNGSKASFLAGGEFPYVVSTINGPTVQFKPYGVRLNIEPRVDRKGNVRASIDTEVSSIDSSVTTNVGPGLLSRKTNTEFNVHSGETIVLSGLIQRENASTIDKIPGLGDIPIIGALFRSKKFQNKETELVIFVTPTVINAQSPGVVDRLQKTQERLHGRYGNPPYLTDPLQPNLDPSRLDKALPIETVENSADQTASKTTNTGEQTTRVTPAQIQVANPLPLVAATQSLAPVSFERPLGSTLKVLNNGIAIRGAPNYQAESLIILGAGSIITLRGETLEASIINNWVPVQVGAMIGWVPRSGVEPSKLNVDIRPYLTSSGTDATAASRAIPAVAGTAAMPFAEPQPLSLDNLKLGSRYSVLLNRLAVRVTADVNAPVVQNLAYGQVVNRLILSPRGAWVAIEANGQRGWVAAQWLQPVAPKN